MSKGNIYDGLQATAGNNILTGSATWTAAEIADGANDAQEVTVTGADNLRLTLLTMILLQLICPITQVVL
jgi:hypothetical protein